MMPQNHRLFNSFEFILLYLHHIFVTYNDLKKKKKQVQRNELQTRKKRTTKSCNYCKTQTNPTKRFDEIKPGRVKVSNKQRKI